MSAALLLLLASGCGSDRSDGPKERFIAQADKVCAAHRPELLALRQKIERARTSGANPREVYRAYAVLTGQAADASEATRRELAAIEPPPADRAKWSRILALGGEIIAVERQAADAAAHLDAARLARLAQRLASTGAEYRRLALAYGFRVCGHTA